MRGPRVILIMCAPIFSAVKAVRMPFSSCVLAVVMFIGGSCVSRRGVVYSPRRRALGACGRLCVGPVQGYGPVLFVFLNECCRDVIVDHLVGDALG